MDLVLEFGTGAGSFSENDAGRKKRPHPLPGAAFFLIRPWDAGIPGDRRAAPPARSIS